MLDVIDASVKKAFDALSDLPTVAAQKAHLDFLRDKYAHAERDVVNLQKENLELRRASDDIKDQLAKAKRNLAELAFQTILADIGPCKVKIDVNRSVLPGYYCPKCGLHMDRGDYGWGLDHLICQECKSVHVSGKTADQARELFAQRLRESQEKSS